MFAPGWRFSALDGVVLLVGAIASIAAGAFIGWVGFVVAFTVAHFFLFCNVVRLSRPLELAWAAAFVALCAATILLETPGWIWTATISLAVTAVVVVVEMRKPSYHGVGWQRINPGLRRWWESRYPTPDSGLQTGPGA